MMWVYNLGKTSLINTEHIIRLTITNPMYEQKDYRIVALLTDGTQVMFQGTKVECEDRLSSFGMMLNRGSL